MTQPSHEDGADVAALAEAGPTDLARPSLNERVTALVREISVSTVTTDHDKDAVARLRYACYLREQAIVPSTGERLSDVFDDHATSMTFGLRHSGELVASLRLHLLTQGLAESPTMQAFGDAVSPVLAAGHRIVDCSRFVVDRDASSRWPELAHVTLRLPILAAEAFGASRVLAAVRLEHMPFYSRVLFFEQIALPRLYLQLIKPLGLMMVDYPSAKTRCFARYPFFAPSQPEIGRMKSVWPLA